jgi:hypothetical protein
MCFGHQASIKNKKKLSVLGPPLCGQATIILLIIFNFSGCADWPSSGIYGRALAL